MAVPLAGRQVDLIVFLSPLTTWGQPKIESNMPYLLCHYATRCGGDLITNSVVKLFPIGSKIIAAVFGVRYSSVKAWKPKT